jgi:hypothetical protein
MQRNGVKKLQNVKLGASHFGNELCRGRMCGLEMNFPSVNDVAIEASFAHSVVYANIFGNKRNHISFSYR